MLAHADLGWAVWALVPGYSGPGRLPQVTLEWVALPCLTPGSLLLWVAVVGPLWSGPLRVMRLLYIRPTCPPSAHGVARPPPTARPRHGPSSDLWHGPQRGPPSARPTLCPLALPTARPALQPQCGPWRGPPSTHGAVSVRSMISMIQYVTVD